MSSFIIGMTRIRLKKQYGFFSILEVGIHSKFKQQ